MRVSVLMYGQCTLYSIYVHYHTMYKAQAGTIHLFVLSILFTEYSNADSNEIMYVILQNLEKLQFYRNTVVRRREKCCPPQTASLLSSWMVRTVLRPPLLLRYSLHPHLTWRHHHHHHHPPSSFRATRAPSSAGGAWLPWVICRLHNVPRLPPEDPEIAPLSYFLL